MIRNVVLVGAIAAMLTSKLYSCEDTPGQLSLSVSGATAGSTANYYVVQIPDPNSGDVTVTLTGSGDTPCPDECECDGDTQAPAADGDPTYDFTHSVGDRDNNVITWTISSGTTPGEYTFKLDQITQAYETCPEGYTGGSSSESNSQASPEVTVLACQITSQTLATTPNQRDRGVLGIGEQVFVTFNPSKSVSWSVDKGTVNLASGISTMFTAADSVENSTVTATIDGVGIEKKFSSILPSSINGIKNSSSGGQSGSVSMNITFEFQPTTVSFYRMEFREITGPASNVTGYFEQFSSFQLWHTPNPNFIGTSGYDNLFCCDTAAMNQSTTPYSQGGFDWDIPIEVRVLGSSTQHRPFNILQQFNMLNASGDCSINKVGLTAP